MAALVTSASVIAAQDQLILELTRPDGKSETLPGRLVANEPQEPDPTDIRTCGTDELALRKVSYSAVHARFSYYLLQKKHDDAKWREWIVGRDDEGRFQSARLDSVKVYTNKQTANCGDFRMPIYCVANCGQPGWWKPTVDSPQSLTAYWGAATLWDVLLEKEIPFDVQIVEPSFSLGSLTTWRTDASVGRSVQDSRGRLHLSASTEWKDIWNILFQPDEVKATLEFRSEIRDSLTESVGMPGSIVVPVKIRPVRWLLIVPLIVGTSVALIIRKLAYANVQRFARDWVLLLLVSTLLLALAIAVGAKVEVATQKLDAEGLLGAFLIALTAGLSGHRALDKLMKILGLDPPPAAPQAN